MGVGDRIAWYRRRRGIPQEALAGLVGRTADWLSKVENNRIALDRLSVLRNLADALGVPLRDLLGEQAPVGHRAAGRADLVTAVRESLMDYHTVSLLLRAAAEAPVDLETLEMHVRQAWDAAHRLPPRSRTTQRSLRGLTPMRSRSSAGEKRERS